MVGSFGVWQLILFSLVVLLVFGHRLPGTMRSLGEGILAFKKGMHETDPAVESEPASRIE